MSLKELLESRRNSVNVASVSRASSQAFFIHFEGNDVESCESAMEPKPNAEMLSYYQKILEERQNRELNSKFLSSPSLARMSGPISASLCSSESIQIPAGLPNTPELFTSDAMEIYHTDSDGESHSNFSVATAFPEMDFGLKAEDMHPQSNDMDALFTDLTEAAAILQADSISPLDTRRKSSLASLTYNMQDMGFHSDLPLLAHVHNKRRKSSHHSPLLSPVTTLPSLSPSPPPSLVMPMFGQQPFSPDTTDLTSAQKPFILPAEFDSNTLTSIALRCIEPAVDVERLKPLVTKYINMRSPASSGERTVMILTSKVAQKSYGTEKR
jgi:hypothetical protein